MPAKDGVLAGGIAVRLGGRDERFEAGREDNEVAGAGCGDVRVGVACGDEDCSAGAGGPGAALPRHSWIEKELPVTESIRSS